MGVEINVFCYGRQKPRPGTLGIRGFCNPPIALAGKQWYNACAGAGFPAPAGDKDKKRVDLI